MFFKDLYFFYTVFYLSLKYFIQITHAIKIGSNYNKINLINEILFFDLLKKIVNHSIKKERNNYQ